MWSSRIIRRLFIYQLATVALASLLAFWLWRGSGFGVFIGGLFACGNLLAIKVLVERTLVRVGGHRLLYGIMLALKTAAALAVIAVLLLVAKVPPLAFGLGLVVAFLGLLLALCDAALSRRASSV